MRYFFTGRFRFLKDFPGFIISDVLHNRLITRKGGEVVKNLLRKGCFRFGDEKKGCIFAAAKRGSKDAMREAEVH